MWNLSKLYYQKLWGMMDGFQILLPIFVGWWMDFRSFYPIFHPSNFDRFQPRFFEILQLDQSVHPNTTPVYIPPGLCSLIWFGESMLVIAPLAKWHFHPCKSCVGHGRSNEIDSGFHSGHPENKLLLEVFSWGSIVGTWINSIQALKMSNIFGYCLMSVFSWYCLLFMLLFVAVFI